MKICWSLIFSPFPSAKRFPDNSVDKESTCNAGDPGFIPGWGRSAGEGIGYPLQYPSASFVAQLVKNLPAMWKTWVQSLGWEDPLEKGKYSSVFQYSRILQYSGLENFTVHGVTKNQTQPSDFHFQFSFSKNYIFSEVKERKIWSLKNTKSTLNPSVTTYSVVTGKWCKPS